MYRIRDHTDEDVRGSFYEPELQKVDLPEKYRIEKVIKTRVHNKKKQYLVKWLGYPESANSWVDNVEKWYK
jgi:hypothetical protein